MVNTIRYTSCTLFDFRETRVVFHEKQAQTAAEPDVPENGMQAEVKTEWANKRLDHLRVTIGNGITPDMAQSWLIQYETDDFTEDDLNSSGNSPQAILAVQASLRHLGYFDGDRIDGVFGPKTKKAVRAFQKQWNTKHPEDHIQAHGLPTPNTKGRLIKAFSEKKPAENPGTSRPRSQKQSGVRAAACGHRRRNREKYQRERSNTRLRHQGRSADRLAEQEICHRKRAMQR